MLMYKLGDFLGWFTIILFAGAIANYIVKFINKKWGNHISSSAGKRIVVILMKTFVRNHRYFGFGAFIALFLHFVIQFLKFGFSVSGIIAGAGEGGISGRLQEGARLQRRTLQLVR